MTDIVAFANRTDLGALAHIAVTMPTWRPFSRFPTATADPAASSFNACSAAPD
jgi:hypothetical protein